MNDFGECFMQPEINYQKFKQFFELPGDKYNEERAEIIKQKTHERCGEQEKQGGNCESEVIGKIRGALINDYPLRKIQKKHHIHNRIGKII